MSRNTRKSWWKALIAWLLSLFVLVPFLLVFLNSVKTQAEATRVDLSLPQNGIQWENYAIAVEEGKLLNAFKNSAIITLGTVTGIVVLCSLAAFVLSRNRSRFNKGLYLYLLIGMFGSINMVTMVRILKILLLNNTFLGTIFVYIALQTSFSIFLLYGFINSIPKEIDEAAIIDGCTGLQLFFKIIFPLLRPVIVTLIIIIFMGTWSDFLIPLYSIGRTTMWPMTMAIFNFFGIYINQWHLIFATIVLTILPILIVYLLGQKYIISGMTAGAVKS
ncbi:MAG: carbohydrate ABC transporter permease [Bacillota bacterium]